MMPPTRSQPFAAPSLAPASGRPEAHELPAGMTHDTWWPRGTRLYLIEGEAGLHLPAQVLAEDVHWPVVALAAGQCHVLTQSGAVQLRAHGAVRWYALPPLTLGARCRAWWLAHAWSAQTQARARAPADTAAATSTHAVA